MEREQVSVEGHTDSRGESDMNRRLSQGRADSVRRYLIDKGVSPKRLKAVGHGEDKPLQEGEDDDANAKNRRVESWSIEAGVALQEGHVSRRSLR